MLFCMVGWVGSLQVKKNFRGLCCVGSNNFGLGWVMMGFKNGPTFSCDPVIQPLLCARRKKREGGEREVMRERGGIEGAGTSAEVI